MLLLLSATGYKAQQYAQGTSTRHKAVSLELREKQIRVREIAEIGIGIE